MDHGPLGSYPAAPITCCFRWTCQCANSNCLTKGFTPPVRGMNPETETVLTRTPCREAPANGKAKVLATSERIQADGGRAFQQLPEHCSTCEGTGHSAATAIQVETRRNRTFACRPVDPGFATLDRHDRSSNKRRNRLLEWHREFPRCILQALFGPPNQKARPRTILEAT